ncbi:MAG: GTPase Era [Bacilli bacterium]|nr:GTPase Era [Bacilli bacterium]
MKSGFISIIGRPNVGKSTLLNTLLDTHIAIVSNVAGTTRNAIQGVYNDDEAQIIFIDTPGIHKPQDKLGKYLNKQSYESLEDVDAILFVVDATSIPGKGDKFIIETFKNIETPVILVLNKIDKLNDEGILRAINAYKDLYNFSDIIPISALKDDNTKRLIKILKGYLTDEIKYYDDGTFTNTSLQFMLGEFVREKILNLTNEEVPHSVTCVATHLQDKGNIIEVYVDIIIDRNSLKKIIIGSGGSMLKQIGSLARKDMEDLLGKQVYLELYVKTIKNWRDKERYLSELGFKDFE